MGRWTAVGQRGTTMNMKGMESRGFQYVQQCASRTESEANKDECSLTYELPQCRLVFCEATLEWWGVQGAEARVRAVMDLNNLTTTTTTTMGARRVGTGHTASR
jgi:hypothetical protein